MTSTRAPGPTISLRDPGGVVAAVPYLLGFAPTRSLVVVGIGADRSVGPTVRCDLDLHGLDLHAPERPPDADVRLVWSHLSRVLVDNGCRAAVVVVYAEHDPQELPWDRLELLLDVLRPTDGPHLDVPEVIDVLEVVDVPEVIDVLDVVLVGPTRFRSLLCLQPGCCPVEGDPLDVAAVHPVAASFVMAGRSPARDRDQVQPPDRGTTATERAQARAAAARARSRRRRDGPTANSREDLVLLEQWCRCLQEQPATGPDPVLAGRLAAGWTRSTRLRDACLAVLLPGGRGSGLDLLVGSGRSDEVFAGLVEQPTCAGVEPTAGPVLRRMASLAEGRERATVLAGHAWLCWVSGDGTSALVLAERAHQEQPGQRLASLVLQCLGHGVGAPWTRPTPWE